MTKKDTASLAATLMESIYATFAAGLSYDKWVSTRRSCEVFCKSKEATVRQRREITAQCHRG